MSKFTSWQVGKLLIRAKNILHFNLMDYAQIPVLSFPRKRESRCLIIMELFTLAFPSMTPFGHFGTSSMFCFYQTCESTLENCYICELRALMLQSAGTLQHEDTDFSLVTCCIYLTCRLVVLQTSFKTNHLHNSLKICILYGNNCRGGEIGRRSGLKIRRGSNPMPVRFRPSALFPSTK